MPGLKTLALTVAVSGGARWETPEQSGWSHFLEHLVFKGAGDMAARDIVERIEAQGGSINAATGYERTSFEVRAMQGGLPLAMQVLGDLVLHPTLDPEEIEREKDVVAQEIAEAFDTPDDHVFEMAQACAFAGQSLGRPILGSVASLAPVTRSDIEVWRKRLYAPERMVVVVSGAVDEAKLLALAEDRFGLAPKTAADNGPARAVDPAHFVGGTASLSRRIEQANLVFQLPAPCATDPDLAAMRVFTEILGGGMASRLFQSAREERGLAYAIDAYHEPYADAGIVGIYAGCAAERAGELARVCASELIHLVRDGPTGAELSRAKAVLKAGLWISGESPVSRAARLASQTLIHGQPRDMEAMTDRLMSVTADDVRRVGQTCLEPGQSSTAVLGPKTAKTAGQVFADALKV